MAPGLERHARGPGERRCLAGCSCVDVSQCSAGSPPAPRRSLKLGDDASHIIPTPGSSRAPGCTPETEIPDLSCQGITEGIPVPSSVSASPPFSRRLGVPGCGAGPCAGPARPFFPLQPLTPLDWTLEAGVKEEEGQEEGQEQEQPVPTPTLDVGASPLPLSFGGFGSLLEREGQGHGLGRGGGEGAGEGEGGGEGLSLPEHMDPLEPLSLQSSDSSSCSSSSSSSPSSRGSSGARGDAHMSHVDSSSNRGKSPSKGGWQPCTEASSCASACALPVVDGLSGVPPWSTSPGALSGPASSSSPVGSPSFWVAALRMEAHWGKSPTSAATGERSPLANGEGEGPSMSALLSGGDEKGKAWALPTWLGGWYQEQQQQHPKQAEEQERLQQLLYQEQQWQQLRQPGCEQVDPNPCSLGQISEPTNSATAA